MPHIINAVREYATIQEICDVWRDVFGRYTDPGIFRPPPLLSPLERGGMGVVWGERNESEPQNSNSDCKTRLGRTRPGSQSDCEGVRDAGFEVIYTGLHQTPEQIVAAAIQEDVDAIGLSSLAGAHDYLFPRIVELLKEKGADDIVVFGGGIIPEEDIPALTQRGVKAVFAPGTSIEEAVKWVRENVKEFKKSEAPLYSLL